MKWEDRGDQRSRLAYWRVLLCVCVRVCVRACLPQRSPLWLNMHAWHDCTDGMQTRTLPPCPRHPVSYLDDEMSMLMVGQVEAPRHIEGDIEGRLHASFVFCCFFFVVFWFDKMSGPGLWKIKDTINEEFYPYSYEGVAATLDSVVLLVLFGLLANHVKAYHACCYVTSACQHSSSHIFFSLTGPGIMLISVTREQLSISLYLMVAAHCCEYPQSFLTKSLINLTNLQL